MSGEPSPGLETVAAARRGVILVEGPSDRAAVEMLAQRLGRDLEADGVAVVSMGGATNISRYLAEFGPSGAGFRILGLVDAAEERFVRRALTRGGYGDGDAALTRKDLERLGFFLCDADLEDELIRALGRDVVVHVVAEAGDLRSWETFVRQPAQRDRPVEAQLRRFLGTTSGRKVDYARRLTERLDLNRLPRPLARLLGA